jgi:hypothetical protein
MSQPSSLWHEIQQHADRVLELVRGAAPKAEIEMPTHHGFILGMFWRCLRLYDATLLLLKAELPEEAAFLARSLFEESLRLKQLDEEPKARTAIVLGWVNRSIDEKRGLMEVAKSIGLEDNIDLALASLEEERRKLRDYTARQGVTSLRAFRSVREAAIRYDRKDDYWTYEWSHESVHGSDAAYMYARRKVGQGAAAIYARTGDPELRAGFAEFAARSLTDATLATFAMFGWPLPPDLAQPVARMRALLDEHAERSAKHL